MAKVLVIPDTHARDFWKEAKNIINEYDKVVFLGDYVDPYSYEFKLSREELEEKTINDFKEIIAFAKQYPDKIVLLDGNHLLHYVNTAYACSRFNSRLASTIQKLYNDNKELFHPCYLIDDVLFSHAGVSEQWVNLTGKIENIDYTGDPVAFINECSFSSLMACGRTRGGRDLYSGPEWLDVHEISWSVDLLKGFYQVFGHTQVGYCKGPWKEDNCACVDTQTMYELDTETHELRLLQEIPPIPDSW